MKSWFSFLILCTIILCLLNPLFAQSPVPPGAKVEKIVSNCQFVEGPVWRKAGFLVFSDIPANTIYKWTPEGGREVFLNPSGNSNGLAEDSQGRLIFAQHGKRQVARLESDGTETALATHYNGKRLNSPNDLTIKSDGSIYFTDPPYGINSSQEELGFYGIYRLTPTGELILLDKSLTRPNGIILSPDERRLYVNDSQAQKIHVWDVQPDFTITNKRLFATMTGSGAADGMKIDSEGRLYSTGPAGVWIFNPDGTVVDRIQVPETAANLNWGEDDRQTLFITARTSVYRIRLNSKGYASVKTPSRPQQSLEFKLLKNYPNPFNAVTSISFTLAKARAVELIIYDALGQQVSTLVNEFLSAGLHHYHWPADNLASGNYYCHLKVGQQQQTMSMILVK